MRTASAVATASARESAPPERPTSGVRRPWVAAATACTARWRTCGQREAGGQVSGPAGVGQVSWPAEAGPSGTGLSPSPGCAGSTVPGAGSPARRAGSQPPPTPR
ncbi:hypothetical protein ACFFX0_17580 [Citricoccus parietis]|uniref:Uncharacterized protein n=1 Tax=Citricoccus parietis TaxID=592307 RepID=A0ABV5G1V3_9MICC